MPFADVQALNSFDRRAHHDGEHHTDIDQEQYVARDIGQHEPNRDREGEQYIGAAAASCGHFRLSASPGGTRQSQAAGTLALNEVTHSRSNFAPSSWTTPRLKGGIETFG